MAIVAAGVVVAGGVAKIIIGAKQAKKAKEALQNYNRQELKNSYENVGINTLYADIQREELARSQATSVQALKSGGVRGLVGGISSVQEQSVKQSRMIAADLYQQQAQIDQMRANDEVRIQQMQERREEQDLAGIGRQLEVGQQNVMSGIGDTASGVSSMAGAFGGGGGAKVGTNGKGGPTSGGGGTTINSTGPYSRVGGSNYSQSQLDSAFAVDNTQLQRQNR